MKTGRNDPCPCGSGKKYKKCCLIEAYVETGREESVRAGLVQEILGFFRKNYEGRGQKRKGTGTFLFFSDHISTITSQKLQQKILQKLQGELFE